MNSTTRAFGLAFAAATLLAGAAAAQGAAPASYERLKAAKPADDAQCGALLTAASDLTVQSRLDFAAAQLKACDQVVRNAASAEQLIAAAGVAKKAHGEVLKVWKSTSDSLLEVAGAADAETLYPQTLRARADIAAVLVGLRAMSAVAHAAAASYADPDYISKEFEDEPEEMVERIPEILAKRHACARAPIPGVPGQAPKAAAFLFISDADGTDYRAEYQSYYAESVAKYVTVTMDGDADIGIGFGELKSLKPAETCGRSFS